MSELPTDAWLSLPDVAERCGAGVSEVRQWLRDGRLLAVRPDPAGPLRVPVELLGPSDVLKGLPGLITLLRDGGYDDAAALSWLLRVDDSLPGRPVDALAENRGSEVKRRAQALAL